MKHLTKRAMVQASSLRIATTDLELFRKAATQQNISVSEFLRRAAKETAERIVRPVRTDLEGPQAA